MTDRFFEQPILNSPYAYPVRHWELDASGQPTQRIVERRRAASFVAPIPKARRRSGQQDDQQRLVFDEGQQLSTGAQQYEEASAFVNDLRRHVDAWRQLPAGAWGVTPETAWGVTPAPDDEDENLTGDARKEAEESNEAAVLEGTAHPPEGLVAVATMHQAKGLEYRAVAVIACDEDVLPLAERLATASDMNELQEVHETERQLLYVAVTRARDELWVSGVAPGSDYLADL